MPKDKHLYIPNENILDTLDEALLVIDKEYNVLQANALFKRTFPDNLNGNKCYYLIGRDSPCQICTCSLSSKKHSSQQKEEKLNDKYYQVSSKILSKNASSDFYYIEIYRDITYNRTLEESLRNKNILLKNNLNIAKQVQQSLLPAPVTADDIQLTYKYIPCEELGGDFFNLYKIDAESYGIYMADVSGHGVSAAMLTMFLNASLDNTQKSPCVALKEVFRAYNDNSFSKNQYITIFLAVIDIRKRTLTYCNAGLNSSPMLFNNVTGDVSYVESSGFPISNWIEDPGYTDKSVFIEPGQKILFYTDGVTEAKSKKGIPYGVERLTKSLMGGNPLTKITLNRIVSFLEDYIDDDISTLKDDISLVILEIP